MKNCHSNNTCTPEKDNCHTEKSSDCDMTEMLMDLANEAWSELLKEKIKKQYEAKIGDKMDKVKAQGGHICSVLTDKEQRSRNYKEAIQNLKKVGDYKEDNRE